MNPDPKPFHFKQFVIHQSQCAMKVGTDGVLLGSWIEPKQANTILDIGCGTGLLSLMLAQKSEAKIDAVEIDLAAAKQAEFNFELSKWNNRLRLYSCSIQEFTNSRFNKYDLIVCNPPFFKGKIVDQSRDVARNQASLPFEELINAVDLLLSPTGRFCCIIPTSNQKEFIQICASKQLELNRSCAIKGNSTTLFKRIMLEFSYQQNIVKEEELVIEKLKRHDYTSEYLRLVEPYLL